MKKAKKALSISTKINFAIFLSLSIMMAVIVVSYGEAQKVDRQLRLLSESVIPLTNTIANVNVLNLEKEIIFDRILRHYEESNPDLNLIKSEMVKFESLDKEDKAEIVKAQKLLTQTLDESIVLEEAKKLANIVPLLKVISEQTESIYKSAKIIVAMEEGHDTEMLKSHSLKLDQDVDELDKLLKETLMILEKISSEEANMVLLGEVKLHDASLMVALLTFITGIVFSPVLTKIIIKTLHQLTDGVEQIAKGDFEIQIPVLSSDEVGVLSMAFNSMANELKTKEKIKTIFGQYVDPRIVDRLINESGDVESPEDGKKIMTVFFSDIEGFSSLSESLAPTTLVKLINHYFSIVSKPINETRGVIDKFIGDAVMAFWGTPFSDENRHAHDACQAALEQFESLKSLNLEIPDIINVENNEININIRIGLCTGEVVAGNVGSSGSTSYTVMGDTVNIAARLESANKQYNTRILIDETTQAMVKDEFEVRKIDLIRVVGINEPVCIYELLSRKDLLTVEHQNLRSNYESAFKHYQNREFSIAEEFLNKALVVVPDDGPSMVLLKRLNYLSDNPLGDVWDGVWNLSSK
ncbi:MAG: hypothetical protein COA79_05470 [Planctomycetota bacterium]|nr:MAG: hypothetical protein COA79_05470 [Planctomycetota bacterium]